MKMDAHYAVTVQPQVNVYRWQALHPSQHYLMHSTITDDKKYYLIHSTITDDTKSTHKMPLIVLKAQMSMIVIQS